MPLPLDLGLQGHVALVTGANHGIGAATALILASHGAAVVVSYLRIPDPGESAGPEAYRRGRAMDAEHVLTTIAEKGGRAIALEADLGDVGSSARLFDAAEAAFGPVDILINNATGWRAVDPGCQEQELRDAGDARPHQGIWGTARLRQA